MTKLTQENYHSEEMNKRYMSVSQLKDFMKCEAMAMAKIEGRFQSGKTQALLVGSYVDSYFEGNLEQFKADNPSIFTQKGELKSEYKQANEIIEKINGDTLFTKFMSGEKQKVFTFKLFGTMWKIKLDSYIKDKCINDLKIMKAFRGMHYWRYDIQGAIYQEGVFIKTKQRLPFYLSVVTKESVMDIDIFHITDDLLKETLEEIEPIMPRILQVKKGKVEPTHCGDCPYCKSIKKSSIRNYRELIE